MKNPGRPPQERIHNSRKSKKLFFYIGRVLNDCIRFFPSKGAFMDREHTGIRTNPLHGNPANPWTGFAHPSHQPEEFEPLLRTLRFASIQLNKFWVEVNAFPVFMNEMKGASLKQIERLFGWLQAAPAWGDYIPVSRLIPDVCKEPSRGLLLGFVDQVYRVRAIRQELAGLMRAPLADLAALQAAQAQLGVAIALSRQLGLDGGGRAEVQARVDEINACLERNGKLQAFFSRMAGECGLAEATCRTEADRVFQSVDIIRRAPEVIWSWRKPQILGPQQRLRIQAWQDRARPVLEARKRLMARFRLEDYDGAVTPDQLRSLGAQLQAGGALRAFSSTYKEHLKHYHGLMRLDGNKAPPKETPAEMAEGLADWAGYIEQKEAFDGNAEAKAFFSPCFRGVDTDFDGALEANAWAAAVRGELKAEDPASPEGHRDAAYCARLVDALFNVPKERLFAALESCTGAGIQFVQSILSEPEYSAGREFAAIGCDDEARLLEATRLRENLLSLGTLPGTPLSRLPQARALADELALLVRRIESASDVQAYLRTSFAGERTDLGVIEAPLAYIEYVRCAGLPESLRNSFLTAYGPQRLQDTRSMVAPALNGLAAVKDHLERLNASTHGASRMLEELPLLDLVHRIQRALKQPGLLAESVQMLRASPRLQ
jgi:hypothetical protein